jgi:hypothetical protein
MVQLMDDGSVSKLSDTASQLSAFELHFDLVTKNFSSALQLLQTQSAAQSRAQVEQRELMQPITDLTSFIFF